MTQPKEKNRTKKALAALLGHMMCFADWLMAGCHTHYEGTIAYNCTWIGDEKEGSRLARANYIASVVSGIS